MAGRYRAQYSNIQIISVDPIAASKCRRPNTTQFHVRRANDDRFNCLFRTPSSSSLFLTVFTESHSRDSERPSPMSDHPHSCKLLVLRAVLEFPNISQKIIYCFLLVCCAKVRRVYWEQPFLFIPSLA
jgi:hypothetical protein